MVAAVVQSLGHSNSLQPHRLQHARLPCPSLSPRVFSFHVHDAIQPPHPLLPAFLFAFAEQVQKCSGNQLTTIYISLMPLNCTPKNGLDLMFGVFLAKLKQQQQSKQPDISCNILPLRKTIHFPMDSGFRAGPDEAIALQERLMVWVGADQGPRMRRHLHLCWVAGTQQMRDRQATSRHTPPALPGKTQWQPGNPTSGRMLLKASISHFSGAGRNFPSLLSLQNSDRFIKCIVLYRARSLN